MDRRIGLSAMTIFGLALLSGSAVGQQNSAKDQLVGAWSLVSICQAPPPRRADIAY